MGRAWHCTPGISKYVHSSWVPSLQQKSQIRFLLHQSHENHKKKEKKIDDKVTIDNPDADTPNASAQDSGSTESYPPYSLINRKFAPYSTTTTKNQKKKENKIGDKVTIDTTSDPNAPSADTPTIPPKMLAPLTPILHIHW